TECVEGRATLADDVEIAERREREAHVPLHAMRKLLNPRREEMLRLPALHRFRIGPHGPRDAERTVDRRSIGDEPRLELLDGDGNDLGRGEIAHPAFEPLLSAHVLVAIHEDDGELWRRDWPGQQPA